MTDNIQIDPNVPEGTIHIDTDVPNAPAGAVSPRTIAPAIQQPPAAQQTQTVPIFGPDNQIYDVPSEKSKDALAAGGSVASPIIAPDGSHMFVPASKLHDALKAGAKIDDTGWTAEQDKLNHRSLAQKALDVVAGPGTIGQDVANRWNKPTPVDMTNPESVHEELSKPAIRFTNATTPEWQKDHPVLTGLMETAEGLSSPENVAMMFATEGLGALSGPESKLASQVVPRVLSAGFSIQQLVDAGQKVPQIWDAIKRGDESEALHLTTLAVGETAMAAMGAQHAAGVEAKPSTIVGERLQKPVDAAMLRLSQSLRSDSKATATANSALRAASIIHDQRLNEHETMTDQAHQAAQERDDAKVKLANGEITQKEFDDANTKASAAAANAAKATKALSESYEQLSNAGAEVDRMADKITRTRRKTTTKQDAAVAGAIDDHMRAFPPTTSRQGQYSPKDAQIALGYTEEATKTNPIHTTTEYADTLQDISDNIDNEVGEHIQKYDKDPITTNVNMDVRDKLGESPQVDFVERGMNYLANTFNLIDPTLEEAQKILTDINALNRGVLKKNFWDVATALRSDPEFAARYWAADSLRTGIDGALVERGVDGVREKRADQAAIIRVKTAVEKQVTKGGQRVRGSGESGPIRKMLGKSATTLGATAGGGIGGAIGFGIGGPVGAELGGTLGAGVGAIAGNKLGKAIAPGDMTRDELTSRIHSVTGKGVPTTELDVAGKPAGQYGPPSPVSPVMQMYTPQREYTPLHSALASHFGEVVGKSSYVDLEQRFLDDIERKQTHNLPLEPEDKKLLVMLNDQNMKDYIAAQKQMQDQAAKSQAPAINLPENPEPLLRVGDSNFAEGMDTHKGIVHEIAHMVVGNQRGINMPDGIGSHLHPDAEGSVMVAPIDWTPFQNEDGTINHDKLKAKITDLAATYMAGGVANDLYHNIPFHENRHLGSDMRILKGYLTDLGFTPKEAAKIIQQGAEDAAQVLQQPGVQEIIEQHASVREPGLADKYHVSPERMEQIIQDVKGVASEPTKKSGKSATTVPASEGRSEESRAGEEAGSKTGDTATVRQEREGATKGEGGSVPKDESANKPRPEAAEPGQRTIKPEEPKLDEDEDIATMGEYQTPLKRNYKIAVIDREGNQRTETVPGFSTKDALKTAQKKFPGESTWGIVRGDEPGVHIAGEPIPAPEGYSIPKGKRLSIRGGTASRPDPVVETHELGHAMVGLNEGQKINGMLRHTHPDMPRNSRAAISWNTSDIIDPATRRIKPDKMPGLLRSLMGGIAADEVFNDTPRTSNHNFSIGANGSDANTAYRMLRSLGLDQDDVMGKIHEAVDQAKQHLTKPAVSDIIKENIGFREPNLSRQFHYSPERLEQMHQEAMRRINAGAPNNTGISGEGGQGPGANVPAGEGAGTTGGGESVPEQAIAAENPKLSGLREQSTGSLEHDQAIREAGAIPAGRMFPGEPYEIKAFHDPQTGSTLGFKPQEPASADAVRQKLAESRKAFGIQPESPKLSSDRVSTRVPEGKNATENPLTGEPLVIDRKALEQTPKLRDKFADKVKKIPGVKIPKNITDPGKIIDRFVGHVADNLKWLYNQSTPEEQTNNAKWYESAHRLTKDLAEKHGISHTQAAGVTAAMSPQMDWDQNVSLAKRIVDIYKNHSDETVTPEMLQKGQDILERSRQGKNKGANANLERILPGIAGKKIGELTGWDRAAALRLYDEVNNPRQYPRIDPATGDEKEIVHTQAGVPQNVAWGNFNNIGKALSILDDGSRENISNQVGSSHKVRNFYNNIIDPTNDQDVTIDTHAVAAGLLQPLSGNAKTVTDNFGGAGKSKGTGVAGTYPLYAEAYRQAARDLGLKPRELQSVTWEKVRNMFPAEWKTQDNLAAVNKEWKKYQDGRQTAEQTRQRIASLPEAKSNKAGLDALGEK